MRLQPCSVSLPPVLIVSAVVFSVSLVFTAVFGFAVAVVVVLTGVFAVVS